MHADERRLPVTRDMTGKRGLYRASARSEGLSPLSGRNCVPSPSRS